MKLSNYFLFQPQLDTHKNEYAYYAYRYIELHAVLTNAYLVQAFISCMQF